MRRFGYLAMLAMAGLAQSTVFAAPRSVDRPVRKFYFLSLAEARVSALDHGNPGQSSVFFPGIAAPGGDYSVPVRPVIKPGSKCIFLAGVRRDPRPAELERNINHVLLNVETAYWNLYGSYWQLYSREEGLRLAEETWKITEAQYRVGRVSRAALAQAEGQYDLFRSQRLAALDTVLDNERQLRAMIGAGFENGARIVPSDAPTLVEKKANWKKALEVAHKKRPEVYLAWKDVGQAMQSLVGVSLRRTVQKCLPEDALMDGQANEADSERQARLEFARAEAVLEDQEVKAERFLGLYYRRLSSAYFQIKAARAQRNAFATQLKIREELYRAGVNEPGVGNPVTLNLLLEAQRFWAESLATECQAIVTYNNALAGWAFAKGEIMKHARVQFAEKASDDSEEVPAVVREQKRTRRHVRQEPALAAESPLVVLDACGSGTKAAPSLPALWKRFPLLKEVGEVQSGLVEGRVLR
jgi:hypothetical protein